MIEKSTKEKRPSIFELAKSHKLVIFFLILLAFLINGLTLFIPKVISHSIDTFVRGDFVYSNTIIEFTLLAVAILVISFIQNILQVYASEKVASNLRTKLADKISRSSYLFIQKANPSALLTYLTADVDSVKTFV